MWWLASLAWAGWPPLDPGATAADRDGAGDSALIVAISDYLLVPDIPGATDNAQAWYHYLTEVRGVPTENVRYLRDAEANNARIERMAAEVAEAGDGRVWVVFIGHGAPALDGEDGLLVGVDAAGDPETLEARSVRRQFLVDTMSSAGRPVTMLLDTCFSGTTADGEALAPSLQPLVPSYTRQEPPPSVTIATAATSEQFAGPLPKAGRPAFSYLMLGAAQGWADADDDGQVTLREAVGYSAATLQAEVTDRRQTPTFVGPGDLVLGRGLQPQPPRGRTEKVGKVPGRGWKITSGVLGAGAVGLGAVSIANFATASAATNRSDLSGRIVTSRATGVGAWSLAGLSALSFTIGVTR